jgi:hypothetical protein
MTRGSCKLLSTSSKPVHRTLVAWEDLAVIREGKALHTGCFARRLVDISVQPTVPVGLVVVVVVVVDGNKYHRQRRLVISTMATCDPPPPHTHTRTHTLCNAPTYLPIEGHPPPRVVDRSEPIRPCGHQRRRVDHAPVHLPSDWYLWG